MRVVVVVCLEHPVVAAPVPKTTTTVHTGPAQVVYAGPRDRRQIALTFHGSGDPALAAQLLADAKRLSALLREARVVQRPLDKLAAAVAGEDSTTLAQLAEARDAADRLARQERTQQRRANEARRRP